MLQLIECHFKQLRTCPLKENMVQWSSWATLEWISQRLLTIMRTILFTLVWLGNWSIPIIIKCKQNQTKDVTCWIRHRRSEHKVYKEITSQFYRLPSSNGRSNPEVVGSIPTEVKRFFSLPRVVPCFPLLGLTPYGLFMGLNSTLIYTSELILCFTICVPSATRHNIRTGFQACLVCQRNLPEQRR